MSKPKEAGHKLVGVPARRMLAAGIATVGLLGAVVAVRWPVVDAQQQGYYSPQEMQQADAQAGDDQGQQSPAMDPPSRVTRVSVVVGTVSVEPASVDQFSAAEVNYPLTTGDRVYADTGATAELDAGDLAVRLGQRTDLTVTAMTDTLAQFGLAQGGVHLRTYNADQGTTTELDTPNVAVTVLQPGDVRVDVDPARDLTTVYVLSGQAQVDGHGLEQVLQAGQVVRLSGSDPVAAQWLYAPAADGLDRFSIDRDNIYQTAMANDQQYVNQDMIGAEDLNGQGDWQTDADYGPVWYPAGVAVDWQPYCYGHWTWVAPWGWTWVEREPWGFAPFHYGRWSRFGSRWGWIPGPPVVRPVYSPALVVFVGGTGVTAWFPLGPREAYRPWYQTSTLYVNRVNVSNIYNRNAAEVRNTYNQRTVNVFAEREGQNRTYMNRQGATIAVDHASFASGRPVAQTRVDARGLENAQIEPHPMVTPQRSMVVPRPADGVPVRVQRPELASHGGVSGAAAAGGRPINEISSPAVGSPGAVVRPPLGIQPATGGPARMPANMQPRETAPQQQQSPAVPIEREQPLVRSQQPEAVSRPLFNKAVPPEPRPSFEQQQGAMERSDPGRPLSPQQLNNLRQNQPAGQPTQREMPHPQPAPQRSAPPPPAPKAAPAPAKK
jgi:hypothetical protein